MPAACAPDAEEPDAEPEVVEPEEEPEVEPAVDAEAMRRGKLSLILTLKKIGLIFESEARF